jgi:hypothetical protein
MVSILNLVSNTVGTRAYFPAVPSGDGAAAAGGGVGHSGAVSAAALTFSVSKGFKADPEVRIRASCVSSRICTHTRTHTHIHTYIRTYTCTHPVGPCHPTCFRPPCADGLRPSFPPARLRARARSRVCIHLADC